jgi:hypothetical protein
MRSPGRGLRRHALAVETCVTRTHQVRKDETGWSVTAPA